MLGKLLEYDMKALARPLVPLHITAVALGAFACLCGLLGSLASGIDTSSSGAQSIAVLVGVSAMAGIVFSMIALMCAPVATLVIVVHRFYRNLFTDEGYLTFTLPVTANSHLLSKTITGFVWLLIDFAVVLLCALGVSASIYGAQPGFTLDDSLPVWMLSAFGMFYGGDWTNATVWGVAQLVVGAVSMLLMAYLAFTLGATVASRHKVAAGIGFFALFSWGSNFLTTVATLASAVVLSSLGFSNEGATGVLWHLFILALALIVAAACYLVCLYLFKRKINLP